ncbi:MAG: hypothetical protein QOJ50_2521 [Cryptosporangiaceae bacterium]|nr:hypothetical protein [Cryptosporangiaceae bacterium]
MSSRRSSVRVKVVALLVSLVALWAFAASVTLREGLNLLSVATLATNVGSPTEALVSELQNERRLSLVTLSAGNPAQKVALSEQRAQTDKIRKEFEYKVTGDAVTGTSSALDQRIADTIKRLNTLGNGRAQIDAGVDRVHAAAIYTDIINTAFRIYGSMATLDDADLAKESRTLVALSRAREVLSQEDALLAGVLAAGRYADTEHEQFVELAGTQHFLYTEAEAELPIAERDKFRELTIGDTYTRFQAIEDRVVGSGGPGTPLPIDAKTWNQVSGPLFSELRSFELDSANGTIERAKPAAIGVIIRLGLAGGLGLLAVIASIVMSITTARSLVQQLEKLRAAAYSLANERLPSIVERLRRGEEVDVEAEAPPLSFGTGEIGEVGRAFNLVQQTAISTAVEQAELRRGIRDVFLSLARRTQALVHRQLTLLDAIERRESKPEELEDLFRVDHLATRMRRNAENLIVLSGAVPGRGWRNPVPLIDVVRGAVAEVEDYARVSVGSIATASVAGRAVGDIIHLLAELVENAASFSPPHTSVEVSGQMVANGFVIEVEDRGLGMSPEDLESANEQLANPPEFNLSSTARLGLYVVGRLAERHGIRVQLRHSAYGGTTAVVLIPRVLVTGDSGGDDEPRSLRQDHLAHTRPAPAPVGAAGSPTDGRTAVATPITTSLGSAQLDRRRDRLGQRRQWKVADQRPVPTESPEPPGPELPEPPLPADPASAQVLEGEVLDRSAVDDAVAEPVPADPVGAHAEPSVVDSGPRHGEVLADEDELSGLPVRRPRESGVTGPAGRVIEQPTQQLPRQPLTPRTENGVPQNGSPQPANPGPGDQQTPGLPQRYRGTPPPADLISPETPTAGLPQRNGGSHAAPVHPETPNGTTPHSGSPNGNGPSGGTASLPQRVRQASLAEPLKGAESAPDLEDAGELAPRPPEEVRRKMASYQLGTVRGRIESETIAAGPPATSAPSSTPDGQPAAVADDDDRDGPAPSWSGPAPGDR